MAKFQLLGSQKNQVFRLIQDREFSPTEFEWREGALKAHTRMPTYFPKLVHVASQFYFNFYEHFSVSFTPGEEKLKETIACANWDAVTHNVQRWLTYLSRELQSPDLWEMVQGDNQLVRAASDQQSDNEPFSPTELIQVKKCIEDIKKYVVKIHTLTEDQKAIIDARFDYVEEAATRLGRKDWLNILITTILGIAITLGFSGDSTRDLFSFAAQLVRQLLGSILYLPDMH